MKTLFKLFFSVTVLFGVIIACSSNDDMGKIIDDEISIIDDDDPMDNDPETEGVQPVEVLVKVVLPESSELDLSTTEIVSFGQSFPVSTSGDATILINPVEQAFVSLQEKDGGVIFIGFISEQDKELSIESSAKASLYFALGTVFQFNEIKNRYFNEYNSQSNTKAFHDAMTQLFLADKNFMEKEVFIDLVKTAVVELVNPKEIIDLNKGIIVDTKEKSGVRVTNNVQNSIGFQSRSRRRTHSFMYKTKVKKEGANDFETRIADVSGDVKCDRESEIQSTDGFTSTLGTIWDVAWGKGQDLFIKDTPPVSLPLENGEEAAKWEARVIGPHCTDTDLSELTNKEREKMAELSLETFAYDMVLPILGTAIGFKEFNSSKLNLFKDAVVAAMGSSTTELVFSGKYKEATKAFVGEFTKGLVSGQVLEPSLQKVGQTLLELGSLDDIKFSGDWNIDFSDSPKISKLFKPLAIVDALLQANDSLGRVLLGACNSNPIETWDITVNDANNVTCLPNGKILNIGESQKMEAIVANDELTSGQNLVYIWETPGVYGRLSSTSDVGNLLATTDVNNVSYQVTATDSELLFDEVEEQVNVTVYLEENGNRTEIGKCENTIKIVRDKWKIRPDGATLEGGDKLRLRVVDSKNRPITVPEGSKMRIEWNTPGEYGMFNGFSQAANILGGDQSIVYECLDYETTNGVEDVSAKIYFIDDNGENLKEEVEGFINIKNDPYCDTDLYSLVVDVNTEAPTDANCPDGVDTAYIGQIIINVPKDDEAISYRVDWSEVAISSSGFDFNRPSISWTNENINTALITDEGNSFRVYSGVGNGASCSNNPNVGSMIAYLNGISGYATFTVCYD